MRRAAALALLLAAGCVAEKPAPPPPACRPFAGVDYCPGAPLQSKAEPGLDGTSGPAVRQHKISFVGAGGERVPGTLTLPASQKPAPCVILVHGLGGSKEDVGLLGLPLLNKGWATLAIDLPAHGARVRSGERPLPEKNLTEVHDIAARAVVDLRRATDFLVGQSAIDRQRLGLIGISLGAILGADFLAEEPRIKAAALWSGGAQWGKLLTRSQHPFAKKMRERGLGDEKTVAAAMRDVEPETLLPKATGRRLLFLWGDRDDIVPTACCEALFQAAPEPKQKVILPGGHVPDPLGMAAKSVTFLEEAFR